MTFDPAQLNQAHGLNALGGAPATPQHTGHMQMAHGGLPMFGRTLPQFMPQIQGAFDQNQGNFDGFKNALMGMYPGHGGQMHGGPIPGSAAPGMPNTQFPLNPGAGGQIQGQQMPAQVGTQMGVIGATPATSPFGLPTY